MNPIYPTNYGQQTFSLEQVQQMISQSIQQALQQHGLVPPPVDMAAIGEGALVAFGNNLTQADAEFFKAHLHTFIPFLKSEQGKELSVMLIEEMKAYK